MRTEITTRALKHRLEIDATRAWWAQPHREENPSARIDRAWEERWFSTRSRARVADLLQLCAERFAPWPEALDALRAWQPGAQDAAAICHVHAMLADPLYRELAGVFIPPRRAAPQPWIAHRDVLDWLRPRFAGRWTPNTLDRLATGLLGTAREAGLVAPDPLAPSRAERLRTPDLSQQALLYTLHLLRDDGALDPLDTNPWLASFGLDDERLRLALTQLHGARLHDGRVLLDEPSLAAWARHRSAA